MNERIKDWQDYFIALTKKVFILLYGSFLQNEFDKRTRISHNQTPSSMLQMFLGSELDIRIPCTPQNQLGDYEKLHMLGMMKQEDAGRYMFNTLGLPLEDMTIEEPPMMQLEREKMAAKKQKTK